MSERSDLNEKNWYGIRNKILKGDSCGIFPGLPAERLKIYLESHICSEFIILGIGRHVDDISAAFGLNYDYFLSLEFQYLCRRINIM